MLQIRPIRRHLSANTRNQFAHGQQCSSLFSWNRKHRRHEDPARISAGERVLGGAAPSVLLINHSGPGAGEKWRCEKQRPKRIVCTCFSPWENSSDPRLGSMHFFLGNFVDFWRTLSRRRTDVIYGGKSEREETEIRCATIDRLVNFVVLFWKDIERKKLNTIVSRDEEFCYIICIVKKSRWILLRLASFQRHGSWTSSNETSSVCKSAQCRELSASRLS